MKRCLRFRLDFLDCDLLNAVFSDFGKERLSVDAQDFCRFAFISVLGIEDGFNILFFHLFKGGIITSKRAQHGQP